MIRMRLIGVGDLKARLRALPREVTREVDGALAIGARLVATDAATSLRTGPRTGREYLRPGGRVHVASAPGEPPASDTGRLERSIRVRKSSGLEYQIVASAPYSGWLERGTRKMDPRPYLKPALRRNVIKIKFLIKAAIQRSLKKISKGKRSKRR